MHSLPFPQSLQVSRQVFLSSIKLVTGKKFRFPLKFLPLFFLSCQLARPPLPPTHSPRMSELPTHVDNKPEKNLHTNVTVPHKHRGGTYLRKHLGVGAHKGDRNAQRLLKSRKLKKQEGRYSVRGTDQYFSISEIRQMPSLSWENSLELPCSASLHSLEQQ